LSKVTRELSQLVLPGDKLGVVEEFLPGAGTYEHDGTIYAHYTGTARLDIRNKRVTVVPATRNATILKEGVVESVEVRSATLNDVFLHYTGREIREESGEGGVFERIARVRSGR